MEKQNNKSITDRVWDLFASVKLAIVIFTIIASTSMVGTILEQQADPEKNVKVLSKMFGLGHDSAHSALKVLDSLGFTNMYHSWWFVTLLLLFCANLIICSIDRLPHIWKLAREHIQPLPPELLDKVAIKRSLTIKGKASGAKELSVAALLKLGFKPAEATSANGVQFYAEKGNYTRLGVYVTHLSLLVILAGAMIGLFFGFNAFLNLPEGETTSVAYKDRGTEVPLGFELRCDNFEVDYYGQGDMPKSYKSWLTVFKNGKEILKKSIVVNDPLTFEGITFYQSSYGKVPNSEGRGIIILRAVAANGTAQNIQAKVGDSFMIPGSSVQGRILDFSPALSVDPTGRYFSYDEMLKNPAIQVAFTGLKDGNYTGWILKRYPNSWNLPGGERLEFLDYWGVEYTGMQVRKDPGVFIVYLGCIIMALGLYVTFFMSHRRVWVQIAEDKGSTRITIAASAHRNKAAFENRIDKLVGILNAGSKGESK
ncbi:MAG: cytochrome c biogenesis protein ResB [Nitrospirae bacterium]|nr:MAG: cytochrome c biogenesis protein ResB [Nitrospirota bacterium]